MEILRSDSRRASLAGMTSYFILLKCYHEINKCYFLTLFTDVDEREIMDTMA